MKSLRRHEGYILLDNRSNSGIPDAVVHQADLPPGAGQGTFEAPTYTCSHCQAIVVINPDRSRERALCRRCMHYICDGCGVKLALTRECKPFKQIADEIQEAGLKGHDTSNIILPFIGDRNG